jgi:hypothetical protein
MTSLSLNPQVVQLARDLHLPIRGDCLDVVTQHALTQVAEIIARSPLPLESLELLKEVLADALSVTLCYIDENSDIDSIVADYGCSFDNLEAQLRADFVDGRSEGLLLALLRREEWQRKYLAIIDRRGEELNRANFTAWHELAHLLTTPTQLAFSGLRRSPGREEILKDPIEQVTDHVAGQIAFYDPLFRPIFAKMIGDEILTFDSIERVRAGSAPAASFYSTAIACVRLSDHPTLLLKIEPRLRASEQRQRMNGQFEFGVGSPITLPAKLRVAQCYPNVAAQRSALRIFKQMRIPPGSVLRSVYDSLSEVEQAGREDQSCWETSKDGPLPSLPIDVRAIRRGTHVYGMISPVSGV